MLRMSQSGRPGFEALQEIEDVAAHHARYGDGLEGNQSPRQYVVYKTICRHNIKDAPLSLHLFSR